MKIFGVAPTNWENSSWTQLSWIGDEEGRSTYFQILNYALARLISTQQQILRGKKVYLVQEFITLQSFGHH